MCRRDGEAVSDGEMRKRARASSYILYPVAIPEYFENPEAGRNKLNDR